MQGDETEQPFWRRVLRMYPLAAAVVLMLRLGEMALHGYFEPLRFVGDLLFALAATMGFSVSERRREHKRRGRGLDDDRA